MKKNNFQPFFLALILSLFFISFLSAGNQAINRNVFVGQQTGGYLGYSIATGDFNADGFQDLLAGAPFENAGGNTRGKFYLYFGGNQADTKVDMLVSGTEDYQYLGRSVSSAGDFNGDGFEDFIVGSDGKQVAYIYFGGPFMDRYPDVVFQESSTTSFGTVVTRLGDINGDGFDDVAVADAATVFIYFGNASKEATADLVIANMGNKPAYCGDVNGDGFEDVLIGYPQTTGQATVFLGGTVVDGTADVIMMAPYTNDQFASSLAGGADVNGDGYSDVVIGAENDGTNGTNAGAAYLYFGGPDMINSNQIFGYAPSIRFYGDTASVHFGHAVGFSKDMDGDGFSEVLVAENHFWYSSKPNRAFVFKGGRSVKSAPYRILHGEEGLSATYFGNAFASTDFNADGYSDIFVGSYGLDKVFMFQNKPTGTESIPDLVIEKNDIYYFSFQMDANGDFNGDGFDDILAGSYETADPLLLFWGGVNMDTHEDVSFAGGTHPHLYVRYVGDVNGDGYDDFIGLDDANQAHLVYGGKGPSYQTLALSDADYSKFYLINSGDINGDGFNDFILSTIDSEIDSFLVFYGGRSISGEPDRRLGNFYNSMYYDYTACLDINGDGYDDLIHMFYESYYKQTWIRIYLGGGDGLIYFNRINPQDFGAYTDIIALKQAGDVNNDGFEDCLIRLSDSENSRWAVLFGNATGEDFKFDLLPDELVPTEFGYAGDLTGDGIDDLEILDARTHENRISVFPGGELDLNESDIYYQYLQDDNFGSRMVTGDLNGDGIMDVISGNHNDKIYTFLSSPVNSVPRITAVRDVPADQGGRVTVVWFKSAYDGGKVQSYRIERSIAPAGSGFAWETIAEVKAIGNNYYSLTAQTLSDAVEGYSGNTYFRITGLSAEGYPVAQSNIAYGHSVDNLAPAAVANLAGTASAGAVYLSWKANTEADLKEYRIYRSVTDKVDMDTLGIYASVTDTAFTDVSAPDRDMFYFVCAVDVHGNGGESAEWLYTATGITESNTLPTEFSLQQNYPNPFNPSTRIRYQVAQNTHVTLTVYNALGQAVMRLVDAQQQPGQYQVTFDASTLASGVYIYRLNTDAGFVQTKKMMLIR